MLPASYVSTQDNSKALEQGREQFIDGHMRPGTSATTRDRQGAMRDVLPVDNHISADCLHSDDRSCLRRELNTLER